MRAPIHTLLPTALLVVALGACGEDDAGGRGGSSGTTDGPIAGANLTKELGCGFGFAQSDEAGRVLLSIRHESVRGKAQRTITFPAARWQAEVRVGTNLAANWCTDVIDEPQAEVEETWRIVEGTLRFAGDVPPLDWEGELPDGPVRAELTGAVVEGPDGERVDLDDLWLVNESWGIIPG